MIDTYVIDKIEYWKKNITFFVTYNRQKLNYMTYAL